VLAGILLLIRHPFRAGDEQRVNMVSSVIHTGTVTVRAYGLLRSEYDVGVVYGGDVSMVRSIALEAVKGVGGVLADPVLDVLL
jgi:small conductance mechanosensitive channel